MLDCDLLRIEALRKSCGNPELGGCQLKHLLDGLGVETALLRRIAEKQKTGGSLEDIRRSTDDRVRVNDEGELGGTVKQSGCHGIPVSLHERLRASLHEFLQSLVVLPERLPLAVLF